jgi:hypothetical protein
VHGWSFVHQRLVTIVIANGKTSSFEDFLHCIDILLCIPLFNLCKICAVGKSEPIEEVRCVSLGAFSFKIPTISSSLLVVDFVVVLVFLCMAVKYQSKLVVVGVMLAMHGQVPKKLLLVLQRRHFVTIFASVFFVRIALRTDVF